MILRGFRVRLGLAAIRNQLLQGNYSIAQKGASSLAEKFPQNAQAIIILADSELFLKNLGEAKKKYETADHLLKSEDSAHEESKRFLRAYISYRLLELEFLYDNHNKVAKPHIVDDINNIPSGTSSKALFFLDSGYSGIPRLYGSRRAQTARS